MPRLIILAATLLACGCNEIRYQASRIDLPPLEVPKAASLPDRRITYECKDGAPFDVFFPPGGVGAVLSLGGDDFALREMSITAGRRFGNGHYELFVKDNGSVYLLLDEKRIRDGCSQP